MDRKLLSSIGGAVIGIALLVQTKVATIALDVGSSTVELGENMVVGVLAALAIAVVASPSDRPQVGQLGAVATLVTLAVSVGLYADVGLVVDLVGDYSPWTGYLAAVTGVIAFVAIAFEGIGDY